jgi:head-tail adaptor
MIRPGAMRYLLTFQLPVVSSDGTGAGGSVSWSDKFNLWAERWNLSGQERVNAARNRHRSMYRWHLYCHRGIIPSMRIKYINGGCVHYMQIVGINKLNNDDSEIEILAEETDSAF